MSTLKRSGRPQEHLALHGANFATIANQSRCGFSLVA
jgi:hypothetical protein